MISYVRRLRHASLPDPPPAILGPSPVQSYLLAQEKVKGGAGEGEGGPRAHVLVDATGASSSSAGAGDDGNWRQRLVGVCWPGNPKTAVVCLSCLLSLAMHSTV
jgi:hypothetical protein